VRAVVADGAAEKELLDSAYAHTKGAATRFLNDHFKDENPFVRFWRGLEREDGRPCRVHGDEATLVVWSPDYDGKGKALVRFGDGSEAIVGASRIQGL
jgi:hypothetical protein